MIPLAAFEAVIDASGVAPQIEALLTGGVRPRAANGLPPRTRRRRRKTLTTLAAATGPP